MTLTAVLKRNHGDGFTAELKELPQFLADGIDEEEAMRNLIAEIASYLTWKSVQELHTARGRSTLNDGLEIQIV